MKRNCEKEHCLKKGERVLKGGEKLIAQTTKVRANGRTGYAVESSSHFVLVRNVTLQKMRNAAVPPFFATPATVLEMTEYRRRRDFRRGHTLRSVQEEHFCSFTSKT